MPCSQPRCLVLSHAALFSAALPYSQPRCLVLSHAALFSAARPCSQPRCLVLSQTALFSATLPCSQPRGLVAMPLASAIACCERPSERCEGFQGAYQRNIVVARQHFPSAMKESRCPAKGISRPKAVGGPL